MSFRSLKYLFLSVMLTLVGCATPGLLPSPPEARLGNANIALNVRSKNAQEFPKGANIRVSLINMAQGSLANPVTVAGDDINLTQADRGVRISFPADRDKLQPCRQKDVCAFLVQVVRNQRVLFHNMQPVFYRAGQKRVIVIVEKTA